MERKLNDVGYFPSEHRISDTPALFTGGVGF